MAALVTHYLRQQAQHHPKLVAQFALGHRSGTMMDGGPGG